MTFDEACHIAMKSFYETHPSSSLPQWLLKATTIGGMKVENDWVIGLTLAFKYVLQPNEAWEVVRGHRVLTRLVPETNTKNIVIHYHGNKPPLLVFQTRINIESRLVEIAFDSDMSKLNESDFEALE